MNEISIKRLSQAPIGVPGGSKAEPQSNSPSFGQMLTDSLSQVNRQQLEADASIDRLVNGKQTDIHQTMIAMEKASVSFELLLQIRKKVISAYDTIMRMPV